MIIQKKRYLLSFSITIFLVLGKPLIPELDLVFAISATSSNPEKTFNKMKEVIYSIIDNYGSSKIHYGFVVFGSGSTISNAFDNKQPNDLQLKSIITNTQRAGGPVQLDNLLTKVKGMYNSHSHSKAKKVLVVMLDNKAITSPSDIKSSANELMDKNVKVVLVAIGNDADPKQLEKATDDEGNVIKDKDIADPEGLGQKIMDRALKGRTVEFLDLKCR